MIFHGFFCNSFQWARNNSIIVRLVLKFHLFSSSCSFSSSFGVSRRNVVFVWAHCSTCRCVRLRLWLTFRSHAAWITCYGHRHLQDNWRYESFRRYWRRERRSSRTDGDKEQIWHAEIRECSSIPLKEVSSSIRECVRNCNRYIFNVYIIRWIFLSSLSIRHASWLTFRSGSKFFNGHYHLQDNWLTAVDCFSLKRSSFIFKKKVKQKI